MHSPSPPLPVGAYVLTQDVPNPVRDKRMTRDWRHEEVFKKGLIVRIVAHVHDVGPMNVTLFEVEPWGQWSHQTLKLDEARFQAMLPHLAAVMDPILLLDEQVRQLTSIPLARMANDVLLFALRSGELRPERVVAIVVALSAAEKREGGQ